MGERGSSPYEREQLVGFIVATALLAMAVFAATCGAIVIAERVDYWTDHPPEPLGD